MTGQTLTANPRPTSSAWFLAGHVGGSSSLRQMPILVSPFLVGRRAGLPLCLDHRTVSNVHAELFEQDEQLMIRDLSSTNGTFVNGVRVEATVQLERDDLVQFAELAFRVGKNAPDWIAQTAMEDVCDKALALVQFDKLMSSREVSPHFQPIVDLSDDQTVGYELLGRSPFVGLTSAEAMFNAAARLDMEVELSRLLRIEGVRVGRQLAGLPPLFVNTHPRELTEPGLLDSIRSLRDLNQDQPITLEIHEAAVTDPAQMKELRAALRGLNVGMAYDDFGAGRTRLVELVEVRPDYLKFDIQLVRGIDTAPASRQQMLETLVGMVSDLGISPLAEGVETEAEAIACRQLGFEFAQGYYFGRPLPPAPCGK